MISYFQASILGLLQGISELFPVSSLGHSVILPRLLGWSIHQNDSFFLTFLVATHAATALVLLGFYWRDWLSVVRGLGQSLAQRNPIVSPSAKLGWLLVIGTIPAGVLGLLLQDKLRSIFASPQLAAAFLTLNGVLLFAAEMLRRRAPTHDEQTPPDQRLARLTWRQSFVVGIVQALALIPGLSRSGSAMGGSLLVGLSNEDAARFAFMLATPIIGAAAALKLPELFQASNRSLVGPAVVGAIGAALAAYVAVKFLTRFFKTNTLKPFAWYCLIAGATASAALWFLK